MTAAAPVRRLGDVLVEKGLITQSDLDSALMLQRGTGKRLGEVLVDIGAIDWLELAQAMAAQWEAEPPAPAPAAAPANVPGERLDPTVQELQEMLRDRQRRVIELSSAVTKLQRKVEQLNAELRDRDARLLAATTA
jgi:type IV pilus assembly protein PilB